jgi:predicted ATPase
MSTVTIRVDNFRVITRLEWSPDGVCLLAGPNGAGKSTILDIFLFLRGVFSRGYENALTSIGGTHIKRADAAPDAVVVFEIEVEDIRWRLRLPIAQGGTFGLPTVVGEALYRGDELIMLLPMIATESFTLGDEQIPQDPARCCAKVVWDRGNDPWMKPLVDTLANIRIFKSYWLNRVQQANATDLRNTYLHGTGQNLWSVLANWKASPVRHQHRFEWVMDKARQAFPDQFQTIEFDRGAPFFFAYGSTDPADGLPPLRVADGLLTGLLHLTAIAGAPDGSIVMFDEVENQLHPHAIRVILAAMRELADARELTVILTSHSPVLMNAFRRHPEQFYVLERKLGGQPKALDELHDADWLAQFSLGDLYDRLSFGAPVADGTA